MASSVFAWRSSGDTIPKCLGELGEIRERTGIAADGHQAGRLEPLALSVSGLERMVKGPTAASKEQRIDFSAGIAWFGDILNNRGVRSSRLDPVRSLHKSAVGVRQ